MKFFSNTNSRVIHLKNTDSTNRYLESLFHEEQPPEGTVVISDYQSRGKGQRGNHWISDQGENLLMSILLRPEEVPLQKQFYLNKVASLAVAELLKAKIDGHIEVKWPNDILVDKKKVGGILINSGIMGHRITYSIIGVGLNINQESFEGIDWAVSMRSVSGRTFFIPQILEQVIDSISLWYHLLKEGKYEEIDEKYTQLLHGYKRLFHYTYEGGQQHGEIDEVEESGHLVVKNTDGSLNRFGIKEIRFSDLW